MEQGHGDLDRRAASLSHALGHPCRMRLIRVMGDEARPLSPVELAPLVGRPLGVVSYHVRQLAAAGLIELVEQRSSRGAVQHLYESTDFAQRLVRSLLSTIEAQST